MKTNKLFLASRWLFVMMTLCCVLPTNAQRKKNFTFEIGISHPVDLGETTVEVGELFGGHVQFSHMLRETPFSIDWAVSYTQYIETDTSYTPDLEEKTWAVSLIPSFNLHFYRNEMFDSYVGIGLGGSINGPTDGTYESGSNKSEYLTVLPRVGVLIANHLNVGFEYHIVDEYHNRGSLTIGYVF